jgi:hypothetical protein
MLFGKITNSVAIEIATGHNPVLVPSTFHLHNLNTYFPKIRLMLFSDLLFPFQGRFLPIILNECLVFHVLSTNPAKCYLPDFTDSTGYKIHCYVKLPIYVITLIFNVFSRYFQALVIQSSFKVRHHVPESRRSDNNHSIRSFYA